MMRNKFWTTVSILAVVFATGANAQKIDWNIFTEPFVSAAHAQDVNWSQVDDVLGRKAAVSGDVHRYGFPRTDLSVTLRLAPKIPESVLVVGESGIAAPADLARLAEVGVTTILIGESLMRQGDVAMATRALIGP